MQTTSGHIETQTHDGTSTEVLLTYSEDERQQNEVNAANAATVFAPAHIQYFPAIKSAYGLTHVETLLYGFIWYYLANSSGRFYFTNEQLSTVLDCSADTVKTAVKKLSDVKLVEFSYRVKAGGGTIRFATRLVKNPPSDGGKITSQTVEKLPANKNKIKESKINKNTNTNVLVQTESAVTVSDQVVVHGKPDINDVSSYFLTRMSLPTEDCSREQSRRYWHLLLKQSKTGVDGVKWLIDLAAGDDFWRANITSSRDLYYKRIKLIARKRSAIPRIAVMDGGDAL